MRKAKISLLVVITLVFGAFTLGFLLGKTRNHSAVTVSVPQKMQEAPSRPPEPLPSPTEETRIICFPIDLNLADMEELTALPGIGQVLAGRILAYREENGSFTAVEELLNVEGIGKQRLEDIWDLITIGG